MTNTGGGAGIGPTGGDVGDGTRAIDTSIAASIAAASTIATTPGRTGMVGWICCRNIVGSSRVVFTTR